MVKGFFSHQPTLYSRVTNFIYIGTNECCLVKGFIKELLKIGIEANISLEERRIDAPFGVKYYLWLPVKNHAAPTPLQFKQMIALKKFKKSLRL